MKRSPRSSAKPQHLVRIPQTAIAPKNLDCTVLTGLRIYVIALSGSLAAPRERRAQVGRVIEADKESVLVDVGGLNGLRGPVEYVPFSSNVGAHLIAAGVV